MRHLLLFLLVASLTACASNKPTKHSVTTDERGAFDCVLDARCKERCDRAERWPIGADGNGDWDVLRGLYAGAGAGLDTCELRRAACFKCIEKAQAAGVLK